jgi:hypothetical protein
VPGLRWAPSAVRWSRPGGVFASPLPPVAVARGLGLAALDLLPPLRSALARQTMGLAGRLPRLPRGACPYETVSLRCMSPFVDASLGPVTRGS